MGTGGLLLAVLALGAPYPEVYCADPSGVSGRWEITLDPDSRADGRRAQRLLERYPDADGVREALARSNLPAQWRDIEAGTLLGVGEAVEFSVQRAGVRIAPGGARFVMVLDVRPPALDGGFALAVRGEVEASVRLRRVRRDAADVEMGAELGMDLRRWLRSPEARGEPLRETSVWFSAFGAVDLDGDGHDEVVVFEHWPEGLYVWLVRHDAGAGAFVAERLCGDAA